MLYSILIQNNKNDSEHMSSDAAKARNLAHSTDASPADFARERLLAAIADLEASIEGKLAEASLRVQTLSAAQAEALESAALHHDQSAAVTQWQNACKLVEEQAASLREQNSQLHSEVHELREELKAARDESAALKAAHKDALDAVSAAITDIQGLLKE